MLNFCGSILSGRKSLKQKVSWSHELRFFNDSRKANLVVKLSSEIHEKIIVAVTSVFA